MYAKIFTVCREEIMDTAIDPKVLLLATTNTSTRTSQTRINGGVSVSVS